MTCDEFMTKITEIVNTQVTTIVRNETKRAKIENSRPISKTELCKICNVTFHTIQNWLKDDGIEHVTQSELDDFVQRHVKYARKNQ